ncbi:MAG TPA: amino acid permease [Pseudonocardia sp.]
MSSEPSDVRPSDLQPEAAAPAPSDRSPIYLGDSELDAAMFDDVSYLEKLGYKQELNRALGLVSSFAVQFSSIAIGSALYTTLIVGLGFFGPASFWSYVVGGALQVLAVGLAMAQLVSAYPLSGGVYQITNRITRLPFLGWQTGWLIIIAHTVAVTAIAVSIVPFIAGWFGLAPEGSAQLPWVLGLIVLVTVVNLVSVKVAAFVNNLGVVCEILGVLLLIGGLLLVKHNTQPLSILNDSAGTASGGWFGPFLFAMILPAYLISSFDATGNAAEETKNAAWNAPLGTTLANVSAWLAGGVLIVLLFVAIPDLNTIMASQTPVRDILLAATGPAITNIFEAFAIVALIATMVVLQLTGIRVAWSQARDGQLPAARWMRHINAARIPVNATIVIGVISVIFALWSGLLSVLTALTALAWALAYGIVVTAGLWAVIRKRLPRHPWHYGKFSPIIFIVAVLWSIVLCVALVLSDPIGVGLGTLGAILVGVVIYRLVPSARRGKVFGVNHDVVAVSDTH